MIILVDNYDSFTYNLVQALGALGSAVEVLRNDASSAREIVARGPSGIVLSPGPGRPEAAGCCVELVSLATHVPLLGVCLGHQAIATALGGRVERAPQVVHGKTTAVTHDGTGLFAGLENPIEAARYHSLTVAEDSLPEDLAVTARSHEVVMAIQHRTRPLYGLQFHPESIATPFGGAILRNFVEITNRHRRSVA